MLALPQPLSRRSLLGFALIAGAVPVAATQDLPPQSQDPYGNIPEHQFKVKYNRWLALRAEGLMHPGTINAAELHAWHEAKAAWAALRHYEDNEVY